jgi:hypothetical protein
MAQPFYSLSGYNKIADMLRRARETVDSYTPGPAKAAALMSGPLGWMTLGGNTMPQAQVLNDHQPPMSPQGHINQGFSALPAANPAAPTGPTDAGANGRVAQGFDVFNPPMMPQAPAPAPAAAPPPAAAPQAAVPMPVARPAAAPQPLSWFQRNAALQMDPMGGGYIDPQAASQVRGPDLINKMMTYLHDKDMSKEGSG